MGALHAGHRSLLDAVAHRVRLRRDEPLREPGAVRDQGDLERYPRDEPRDLEVAQEAGVDIVFAPSADEMYPPGFQTGRGDRARVDPRGPVPPKHRGVATVVLKPLTIVRPTHIYWPQGCAAGRGGASPDARPRGRRRGARPTVRDADGLALSSRNVLLSPEERARALALHGALATRSVEQARALLSENGLAVDYVEAAEFAPPVLAGAVRVGSTRLIDNVPLEGDER